jgi:hypothetical protein
MRTAFCRGNAEFFRTFDNACGTLQQQQQDPYLLEFSRNVGGRVSPDGGAERRVSSGLIPLFRSSARPGYSHFITSDPRRVSARKRVQEVDVRFTPVECSVKTNEGVVHARPGDAILTGTAGEHWRVSRAHFADKYRPVPPTVAGADGRYECLPIRIRGVPMSAAFEVLLADGISRLTGRAGDWLVDYGDGSLGIVSPAIFATTYEIIG